jgi:hypothetical protein
MTTRGERPGHKGPDIYIVAVVTIGTATATLKLFGNRPNSNHRYLLSSNRCFGRAEDPPTLLVQGVLE